MLQSENKTAELKKKIFDYSVYLLSRRDYSVKDITQKLNKKFTIKDCDESESENVQQAIQYCLHKVMEYGYLDDQRYSEAFVRASSAKYRGPIRIRNELKQKGITNEQITKALEHEDIDWFELAKQAFDRKFNQYHRQEVKSDPKLKAKCYRYLSYRGFNTDQINYALEDQED